MRSSRPDSPHGDVPARADDGPGGDPPDEHDDHPGAPPDAPSPDVSIVLPAHNEAAIIAGSIERVSDVLRRLGRRWEIVVVDSASDDGTGEEVGRHASARVRLVRVERPGKGAAIAAGLRAARGRYVGFLDSDLEIDPEELPRFIDALDRGADAAIASKTDRSGERPLRRRLSTTVYNRIVRSLLGTPYHDHQGGMKLFRESAADLAREVECAGWFWDTEVLVALARAGSRVEEITVTAGTRRVGRLSIAPVSLELLRELGRLYAARRRPGGPPGRAPGRPWDLLAPVACAAAILVLLHPRLLLLDSTPAGYDLSGHVYGMWLGVQHLLRTGRIHGWSDGWFAGFPFFYFYFPLPAYLVAALSPLLGFAPAFKVMSVAGLITFPFALYWLLRELGLGRVVVATATVVGCGFLLTGYSDLGGNISSTLGGEFAYGLSFTLSVGYVAALLRARRLGGGLGPAGWAAVFLAGTALTHTITTLAVVVGVAPLLLERRGRRLVLVSWSLALLLSAFWSVPFLVRSHFMWSPYPGTTPAWPRALPPSVAVVALVASGGLWALRRSPAAWVVAWLGLAGLLAATLPQRAFFALRFLPYWYLSLFVFAGVAAGLLAEAGLRKRSLPWMAAALVLAVPPLHGVLRARDRSSWAGRAYRGLEQGSAWALLDGLAGALRGLPPGRVYWEDDATLFGSLGSRHVLTLLPYWAPGHDALRGLWVESSRTAAVAAALDREIAEAAGAAGGRGLWPGIVTELDSLGVRYFITVRPASASALRSLPSVRDVGSIGPFTLFELPADPLVQSPPGSAPATDIQVSDAEIRFHAGTLGVPYRVAVSYFPNWSVEGAIGPRPDGAFMTVVPQRPDVRLRFRTTWVERLGTGLTALGLVLLLAMAARARATRPERPSPSPARSPRAASPAAPPGGP